MVCDSLFGRIVREFESGQPTTFAVLRTRSLASLQRSQPSKTHRVTDNVQLSGSAKVLRKRMRSCLQLQCFLQITTLALCKALVVKVLVARGEVR